MQIRWIILVFALAACADAGGSSGAGTLRVHISGEEASREGFPVGSGDDRIAFADGWTIEFEKVLVSLTDFSLRARDGEDAELDVRPVVADLHLGEPRLWSFEGVPARRWDRVSYRYGPPSAGVRTVNDVEGADIDHMIERGYSLWIAATARKDGLAIAFEYGFPFEVDMLDCVDAVDDTDGIVVTNNGVHEAQVTVHLDHLFFDTFAVDGAALRFDAMAAVAPESGPLTLEDLSRQTNLSDLKDAEGRPLELAYDPGSAFDPVPRTLEEYVIAAATTTGHWNGEGHCDYQRR